MSEPTCISSIEGCYYVVLRGLQPESLFASAQDRSKLNLIVGKGLKQFDAQLHAYCWTAHQLHFLLAIGDGSLDQFVGHVATRYSRRRRKDSRTGDHLFDTRYYFRIVEADHDFLAVVRDIHLIPVTANLLIDPEEYPWSSHRTYLGIDTNDVVTTHVGLSLFSADAECARATYHHFIAQAIARNVCGELSGESPATSRNSEFRRSFSSNLIDAPR